MRGAGRVRRLAGEGRFEMKISKGENMKLKCAIAVAVIAALGGCAAMLPPPETIRFSGENAKFSFVKTGCVLGSGTYTDLSGKGKSRPMLKFIAVTSAGQTVGQWTAFCEAVAPNGTSTCNISGPKKSYYQCDNYDEFMVTN